MRQYYPSQEDEKLAFARKAAKWFEDNPVDVTYREGEFESDSLLALRWGFGFDCVVIVRLGYEEPVNYCEIIDKEKSKKAKAVYQRIKEVANSEANAAYICKAVNMHGELVSMLDELVNASMKSGGIMNIGKAKQLLERAKG